ncbi:putative zinc-binding peptidase [Nocardioidaceae bacterium]|nr:putative zinc-binding peptidase [Nocardioidaceae bacterium]
MQPFTCPVCDATLYFENSVCVTCQSPVAYARADRAFVALTDGLTPCVNLDLNGCNWLPEIADTPCFACSLTRTRPADSDLEGLPQYYRAEQAKRRLLHELDGLGLPVQRKDSDDGPGVIFDLLSSVEENVITGHADGVITLDLAEGDTLHREQVRLQLGEAYRTLLGHFRHEIGHYYWTVLVEGRDEDAFRAMFGDERADYQAEIDRHYSEGPPADWAENYVSEYATMHPWEDWAETFAHVLHIRDALDTAHHFGLAVDPNVSVRRFADVVVGTWLPMSTAFNQINRSLGQGDLYPFVLPPAVIDKLDRVHTLIAEEGERRRAEEIEAVTSGMTAGASQDIAGGAETNDPQY